MTALPPGPVVKVKPQPNVYTLLLIIAILFLGIATAIVMYNLMTHYGLTFKELFAGQKMPSI